MNREETAQKYNEQWFRGAPFGDPVVFRLRGTTLAIGRAQARLIELREESKKKRKKCTAFLPL